ncbi:MAG: uroporphyrinogen decarboxylase family protein [Pseudomonadota bacterium]
MTYSAMARFQDALKGRPKDRVPLFPMVAAWAAANFSDVPPGQLALEPQRIVQAQVRAKEAVGYDALFAYAHALAVPEAFGCRIRFTETGPIADPLLFPMRSLDDVARFPVPDPRESKSLSLNLEVVRGLSRYGKGDLPVLGLFEGPLTTTCRLFEPDLIMRMPYKNKEVLEALLDKVSTFLLGFGQALIGCGANILFVPEPTASSTMISPAMFRLFVLPRLQALMSRLDVPCILHMCGDTSLILDTMWETGAKVLSLDQCMNLPGARNKVPEAVLGGNVDPINALLMGTRERVAENTLKCLGEAGTARFILMTGCGVPPKTSVENLKAMVETAIHYGLGKA